MHPCPRQEDEGVDARLYCLRATGSDDVMFRIYDRYTLYACQAPKASQTLFVLRMHEAQICAHIRETR
jgi:hypothetical protein